MNVKRVFVFQESLVLIRLDHMHVEFAPVGWREMVKSVNVSVCMIYFNRWGKNWSNSTTIILNYFATLFKHRPLNIRIRLLSYYINMDNYKLVSLCYFSLQFSSILIRMNSSIQKSIFQMPAG